MPRSYDSLTLEDAKRILAAAEAKAASLGIAYNIAVVDAGGHLVAFVRQDGALIGSIDLAIPKPAKPEPNRDFEHTPPSVVRAIFGCSADSHPPGSSRSAGANLANPMGSSHYGTSMIASSAFSGQ